jgi:hypothetical protein
VLQHDEYEQDPHRYRRHRKEINRHQLADVVVKKRLPGLSRRSAECPEDSGDRALGDPHAEHLQFSVKPGRAPQRIGRHHALDESANLDGGRRSAAAPAVHPGQMRPELQEALPVPPDDRVGLNVEQRAAQVRQTRDKPTQNSRSKEVSTGRLRFRRKAASCSRSAAFSMATAWWPLSRRRTNRITDKRRAGMCPDCSPSSAWKSTCYERME